MRRLLLVPALGLVLALVSACGVPHVTDGHWASGDGGVQVVSAVDRGDPITLSGTTLEGKHFDLASTRGKVTVVDLWGAWCADCVQEAGDVEAAHRQLGAKVAFVGLDVHDSSADTARAFQRGNHLTYPSLYSPDSSVLLAFPNTAHLSTMSAIPGTVILDKQGRVATVIHGETDTTTLVDAVQDVEDGKAGA
jgi:thiol-disulfide isomerase/thioredoxin